MGGIPVTLVAAGGAPMTPVGLDAAQVSTSAEGETVQEALDARGYVLAQSAVGIEITGSTSEQSMVEIPIPAGALGTNGQIRVSAQYRRTTGAGEVNGRLRFGAAGTAGDLLFVVEPATDGTIQFEGVIAARGANNSQISSLALYLGTAGAAPVATAKDMSAIQYVSICGRTPGNPADVLELQRYQVLLFPQD